VGSYLVDNVVADRIFSNKEKAISNRNGFFFVLFTTANCLPATATFPH
jgi:hypothetical protein